MKRTLFRAIFLAWVVLWASFNDRELVAKGALKEYRKLSAMSLEEKHSYMTGKRLYDFVLFCDKNLPADASYRFAGMKDGSVEQRRAVYYLCPRVESDEPEYVLVFDAPKVAAKGYVPFATMDEKRYIFRK